MNSARKSSKNNIEICRGGAFTESLAVSRVCSWMLLESPWDTRSLLDAPRCPRSLEESPGCSRRLWVSVGCSGGRSGALLSLIWIWKSCQFRLFGTQSHWKWHWIWYNWLQCVAHKNKTWTIQQLFTRVESSAFFHIRGNHTHCSWLNSDIKKISF